jgi:methylase of polypeptide subunit release factors
MPSRSPAAPTTRASGTGGRSSAPLAAFRGVLADAGFEAANVERLVRGSGGLGQEQGLAALRLRPGADERLSVLVRLFLAGEELPAALATKALAPLDSAELEAAGLTAVRDGAVSARVALEPYDDLVLATDPRAGRTAQNHVLGLTPSARYVAALTPRPRVDTCLDVGCGSGVQAFLAARHSERVVGIDVNERALELARLNAELNGIENVEWRLGDLFAPVADERFDLVVSNPPFIVSPGRELLYRDGGSGGDAFSRDLVAGAARHLREGGFATLLCSWASAADGDASAAPRRWLEGSGCDALILHFRTDDPVTYAVGWNDGLRPPDAVPSAAEAWLGDYRARGIEAISTGGIVLRRRDGENWVRVEELPLAPRGAAGEHVERVFAAQDYLQGLASDDELLQARLTLAPETMLVERRRPDGTLERARITVGRGLPLQGRIPLAAAPLVRRLDGRLTAAEAAADLEAETLRAEGLPALRDLIARGLLVPST